MLYDILETLALSVFPDFLVKRKQRRAEWTGVLEEIRKKGGLSLSAYTHRAVFRTAEGTSAIVRLREQDTTRFEKGARYHKRSGEDWPAPLD